METSNGMDKKSPPKADPPLAEKIFFLVFFLLIIASVAVTYWRIMVKRDYIIEAQTDCDPAMEKCFVWECDPESTEEGEACIGDPESDIWYYKIARRNASRIPLCDPNADENCDPWTCEAGEADCEEILCTDENKEEQGVECNDPEEYVKNNPPEEESEEGEEGDSVEEEGDGAEEECDSESEECPVSESEEAEGEVREQFAIE